MTPTEQSAQKPSATTGLFATLRASISAKGTRAPSRPRLALTFVLALTALLAAAAPAFAAGPEPPEALKPEPIKPTEATLQGIVNPKISAATEPGTYQFEYKATKTATKAECESAGASKAPASPGMYFGFVPEPESELVTGLTEGTEYIVCLAATNGKSETTVGPPFPFKTGLKLETPVNAKVKAGSITATTAEVEGELNPGKERKVDQGSYEFIYKVSSLSAAPTGECEETRAPEPAGIASGALKEGVGSVKLENLEPNAKYTFCLRVHNEDGEEATGAPVTFNTPAAPPTIVSETVSHHNNKGEPLAAGEARLEGVLNPNNQLTECHFQYGEASVSEHTVPCEPELLKGFGEQGVAATIGGLSGQPYHYRILAKNGKGEEATGAEQTVLPPEAPVAQAPKPVEITSTTAVLHGVLNPHSNHESEPGTYEFVYRQSATECQRLNSSTGREENEKETTATAAAGAEGEAVQAPVSELLPGTKYTFCLLAKNDPGEEALSAPMTFTTLTAAPVVEEASVLNVAATSAVLQAQVNPEGSETTYRFEYGTSEAYTEKIPVPDGPAGSGSARLTVQAHPQDLLPGTAYHFRVVLEGAGGTAVDGPDHTFTTQTAGSQLSLLDGRQWELVSPAQKHGAEIYQASGALIQAAADGSAISYYMSAPFVGESPPANAMLTQAFSRRGSSGWSTQDIATPNNQLALNDPGAFSQEYMFFSEDLSRALVEPVSELPKLAPDVSQLTLYVRDDSTGSYTAVMNDSNVAAGAQYTHHFNNSPFPCALPKTVTSFWNASPDLSHVVVHGCPGLTGEQSGGAIRSEEEGRSDNLYYEWSAATGRLRLITQLPGYPACAKEYGEVSIGSAEKEGQIMRHAIASDGSVFWGGTNGNSGNHLYVTEPDGSVVQVDQPQGVAGVTQPECYPSSSQFEAASSDGSLVFFKSSDLTSTPVQNALYVYEKGSGKLTLLTAPVNPSEGSAGVLGSALGSSENGSYLYFAATSVLTESENAEHQRAVAGEANLYVMHSEVHNGVREWSTSFIATLDKGERAVETGQSGDQLDWTPLRRLSVITSRVSPDGQYLAFMSDRSLTGYDNHDASSGQPDEELYQYDATSGRLVCASCNPSGARPQGRMEPFHALTNATRDRWTERWVAAAVPGWTEINTNQRQSDRQPRYLSDTGRLFFDSPDALSPHDINGTVDVYEFEPAGTGNCAPSSVTFSARTDGCVGLISGGTGPEESAFVDASASGEDVFFITGDRLVSGDGDNTYDMYDAHACSEHVPCFPAGGVASPACDNEASCRAAPSPQPSIFGSPSSATFAGTGNVKGTVAVSHVTSGKRVTRAQKLASALKACRRDRSARKRALCVRRAHRNYGSRPARKARVSGHTARRAGR